ncbi:hypothetical protein ABZX85_15355 [Streptomyces sp. NPDC004539]|uniref:hypothetical protein n=1 Tax=Streptomyces sp. NPDC004539 TaxID=3154280 RepID=UPI0033AB33AF
MVSVSAHDPIPGLSRVENPADKSEAGDDTVLFWAETGPRDPAFTDASVLDGTR